MSASLGELAPYRRFGQTAFVGGVFLIGGIVAWAFATAAWDAYTRQGYRGF